MLTHKRTLPCIEIFICMILVSFCASAQEPTNEAANDMSTSTVEHSIESRLHKIYVEHYSRRVLDSDWFKIVDAIEEQSYTVKKGDTLWGISKIYFGDGFYWSKLWSVNKDITNPHMIAVNDTLNFKAGSFDSAPSLSVDESESDSYEDMESEDSFENSGGPKVESFIEQTPPGVVAAAIPDFFKEHIPLVIPNIRNVAVERRPPVQIRTQIRVNRDILPVKPPQVGIVKAVGMDRINTGERNRVVLSLTEPVSPGTILTILDSDFTNAGEGFWIKALAVVKVLDPVPGDKGGYSAEVIEQFDGILKGSYVSSYQVKTAAISAKRTPINVGVQIVSDKTKSFWSQGDFIFLHMSGDSAEVGDLIELQTKFDTGSSLLVNNSIVNVVTVNPPFLTGVVLQARTPIVLDVENR
jgi:hypothetical protein